MQLQLQLLDVRKNNMTINERAILVGPFVIQKCTSPDSSGEQTGYIF